MLVKAVRYAYKELIHIKLNDNHIKNDSVEYDFTPEFNNFDEQNVYQKTVVILQEKTFTGGCKLLLKMIPSK